MCLLYNRVLDCPLQFALSRDLESLGSLESLGAGAAGELRGGSLGGMGGMGGSGTENSNTSTHSGTGGTGGTGVGGTGAVGGAPVSLVSINLDLNAHFWAAARLIVKQHGALGGMEGGSVGIGVSNHSSGFSSGSIHSSGLSVPSVVGEAWQLATNPPLLVRLVSKYHPSLTHTHIHTYKHITGH
jgi:hypothetical protein